MLLPARAVELLLKKGEKCHQVLCRGPGGGEGKRRNEREKEARKRKRDGRDGARRRGASEGDFGGVREGNPRRVRGKRRQSARVREGKWEISQWR